MHPQERKDLVGDDLCVLHKFTLENMEWTVKPTFRDTRKLRYLH
jgi:hypothetical protein